MSSTNKTTNYELSQFVGTDKPTFLGDYNGDMLKIDTQMKANADDINSVTSTANTANQNASSALETANTANTNASTALETANSASSSASTANVNALSALSQIANFNLNNFENITNFTTSVGSIASGSSLTVAKNNDGSLAKIYGLVSVNVGGSTNRCVVSCQTSLRPTENITITNAMISRLLGVTTVTDNMVMCRSITLNTNGVLSFESSSTNETSVVRFYLLPCLYFITNFGDLPTPE